MPQHAALLYPSHCFSAEVCGLLLKGLQRFPKRSKPFVHKLGFVIHKVICSITRKLWWFCKLEEGPSTLPFQNTAFLSFPGGQITPKVDLFLKNPCHQKRNSYTNAHSGLLSSPSEGNWFNQRQFTKAKEGNSGFVTCSWSRWSRAVFSLVSRHSLSEVTLWICSLSLIRTNQNTPSFHLWEPEP